MKESTGKAVVIVVAYNGKSSSIQRQRLHTYSGHQGVTEWLKLSQTAGDIPTMAPK
ncbi:hypothetical protein ACFSJY_16790 [Thalassotalea euphylliae]|uniref:hypothetical protein n=1 Tax=Thalassotalea euphylliae TaxID=1655234 RepID=UPI00362E5FCE